MAPPGITEETATYMKKDTYKKIKFTTGAEKSLKKKVVSLEICTYLYSKSKDMKTINPQIDIFESYEKAMRAFNKSTVPCQLLESSFGKIPTWFVDRSKEAIKSWPQYYKLISEKN